MLAAQYEQGVGLRLADVPLPAVGAGEALVAIETASICATDIRIVKGSHRKFTPGTVRIPGHEISARVVETGSNVSSITKGQRVFIAPNMGCGECAACRRGKNNLCPDYEAFGITMDGGFAEYMRVTAKAIEQGNLLPLPEDVDSAEIALAEPLACVLHGQDAVHVGAGDTVLVIGAGPIGLMHLLLAKARGASQVLVSDLSPERLERAAVLGADRIHLASSTTLDDANVDVAIVAAPSPVAQQQAIRAVGPGGRINFFAGLPKEIKGVELDSNLIHYREIHVTGTTGCSTDDCRRAAALVLQRQPNLRPLISAHFPLRDVADAFSAAQSPENLKIVLDINTHAQHPV